MKRLLIGMVLVVTGALTTKAQTPAPEPIIQHFVVSINAGGYGGQKGTSAVTVAGLGVQITTNFSGGYNHIWNPNNSSDPVYKLGVANYTRELGGLCPFCKKHFVFDTTRILATFQGGAGTVSFQGHSKLAGTLGAYLNIPLADHLSYQVLGYQRLFGVGSATLDRNQVNTGIYFTF